MNKITVNSNELLNAISKSICYSHDKEKKVLNSLNIRIINNTVKLATTNGYYLSVIELNATLKQKQDNIDIKNINSFNHNVKDFNIALSDKKELIKYLKTNNNCDITFYLNYDDTIIFTNNINDKILTILNQRFQYVHYHRIIDNIVLKHDKFYYQTLSKEVIKQLKEVIKQFFKDNKDELSLFKKSKKDQHKLLEFTFNLIFDYNSLKLESINYNDKIETLYHTKNIDLSYTLSNQYISFNFNIIFLNNIINNLSDNEDYYIFFTHNLAPLYFISKDCKETYMIIPLRS